MAERALAHIEKVEWVKPIEGADNIELIGVLGWVCVAKKEEFRPGDIAVYIEIDSKCPENDERFAFLATKHYKVKTMKLGKFKVISQGLALPITLFPELTDRAIGTDVTNELKISTPFHIHIFSKLWKFYFKIYYVLISCFLFLQTIYSKLSKTFLFKETRLITPRCHCFINTLVRRF